MEPTTMVETATVVAETAAESGMASANTWAWIALVISIASFVVAAYFYKWVKKLPVANARLEEVFQAGVSFWVTRQSGCTHWRSPGKAFCHFPGGSYFLLWFHRSTRI